MSARETVGWADVSASAAQIFDVWVGGRELQWAEQAWKALEQGGLADHNTDLAFNRVLVRLMTLGVMYLEFCYLAWEELTEPDLVDWMGLLDISSFRFAQLVGPEFMAEERVEEQTFLSEALVSLVEAERMSVYRALKKYFGGTEMLFASLWLTRWDGGDGDEEDDDDDWEDDSAVDDGEESMSTALTIMESLNNRSVLNAVFTDLNDEGKMAAYEWVREGMPSLNLQQGGVDPA